MGRSRQPEQRRAARALVIGVLLSCCCVSAFVHAANIYRYTDASGRVVYNSTIPPEYVKNGYAILNERGQVIEEVPPAPSGEELEAAESRRQAEAQAAVERERQEEADAMLLRLYRSPEEVARKRDERVAQLERQIAALEINASNVRADIEVVEQRIQAADERGVEVADNVRAELEFKRAELRRLVAQKERLEADKANVVAQAVEDMRRLRELLGITTEEAATQ